VSTPSILLAERRVPVIAEADVVVVGGGSAGIAAAVSSARSGARTVMVERYGFLGGNATSASVGTICGLYLREADGFVSVGGGFAEEWAARLAADGMGFGPVPFKRTAVFLNVPWGFKALADRTVQAEPNLRTLLHAPVVEVARAGERIDAVVLGTKRGLAAVTGSVFIDCSGDADVIALAGAEVAEGGPRQFPSMQFAMHNVDVGAAYEAGLDHLVELMRTTGQEPDWNLSRTGGAVLPTGRPGEIIGAMTRIAFEGRAPDMTDPFEATAAEFAGRAEAAKAGRFLVEHMKRTGQIETEILDLAEYNFPIMEERRRFRDDPPPGLKEFAEKIARADSVTIVTPEYNNGYPGVLKNALDYLLPEYRRKPFGIVTVSAGGFGGLNCLAQLRLVTLGMGAFPIPASFPVSRVETTFEEDGTPRDSSYEKRAAGFIAELLWFTEAIATQKAKGKGAPR
jgi:NAD(P)H-dependent FMN reductase